MEQVDAAVIQERGNRPVDPFQLLCGLGCAAKRLERPLAGTGLLFCRVKPGAEAVGLID